MKYETAIDNYLIAQEYDSFIDCPGLYNDVIIGGLPNYVGMQEEESFVNQVMEMNNAT